uniref:Uncharacterized protein n=1 Tax=Panagrolaimus sp. ES5 TaxID=591445 RepID=A0AC34FM07_9BILA
MEDSRNERAKRRAQKKEADDEKKKADDEKKEAAQKKEAEDGKKEVGLLKKGNSNAKPLKNEDVGKQSIEKIVLPKINLSPDSLLQAVEELNARKDINVFFIAQQVDYLTTINDTVKFNIYRDKNVSLLDNMNGIPLKVTLNYETSGTVGDFLVQVICKFSEKGNLHETISFMKDQTVNFEKFTLKQIGTDQFLAPDGILGNHKFIGEFISRGKDVELMIDEKIIREYVKPVVERNAIIDLQKDYKNEKVIYEINKILEKIDDGDLETKQLHDQLFGKVNELTKKCNFILNHEIQCALENMDFKYLKLSIESLLQLYYAATNLYYKNERLSVSPIRFSTDVDELFSIHLKSLNNFPKSVFEKFSSIRLQIELMYGTQPLGINQGEEKSKKEYLKESFIFKELFLNELKICMLPREARIGLSIFGIKKGKSAKMIGFVSLPVFDNDGSLLQGEVIAPFTIKNDTIPEPWGPHPVILSNEDSVVVLKMPEFPCQIRFPEIKEKALFVFKMFIF